MASKSTLVYTQYKVLQMRSISKVARGGGHVGDESDRCFAHKRAFFSESHGHSILQMERICRFINDE
uniref:Uncharacterized protein n=1 Tax=Caenorhabditis japonica TaxID=281687 RepID=A0A8R1ELW9_CAEJA